MKSTGFIQNFLSAVVRPGLHSSRIARHGVIAIVVASSVGGCSTMKDLSPFGSNVPYAQDVKPTIAQPAVTEVPAFKPAPPPRKPVPGPPPAAASTAPAASPDAPPPPPASTPAQQSSLTPPAEQTVASTAAPQTPASGQTSSPDRTPALAAATAPAPETTGSSTGARPVRAAPRPANTPPSIPDEQLAFNDDGAYPNLAQVPARPVNMPTFLEASAEEKTLIADRDAAKNKEPDSPPAPSPDSVPDSAEPETAPMTPPVAASTSAPERAEDKSPCLSATPVSGEPAATLRFQPGSAALSSDDLIVLADAIPTVRSAKGTIRVFGHGDTGSAMSQGARFDLAAARAGAVAQALAGYGIPVPRIAVGVACADASLAGASVQLYADS